MEVRKGYKLTEIGEIPEDWEVKNLGSFSEKVGSGITPTGGEKVYKITGHPFVRSQNVGWGILLLNDLVFIDNNTHLTFAHTEIKENDLLLNITGASIGRCAIANKQIVGGNVNQHVCIIRLYNIASYKFICTYILSPSGQKQINNFQAGGNRQGLNFQQVKSINVPFPPDIEQKRIASALSDIDFLISSLEQLIAKKRLIKQGVMQELLTGKKRLPGFEGEWENAIADNHGIFIRGISYDPDKDLFPKYNKYGAILLRANNIKNNTINFLDIYYINKGIIGEKQILVNGDILFCMANGSKKLVGKSAGYNEKCIIPTTFGAFMGVFRPFKNISDKNFIKYVFQSDLFINYINIILAGSAINNLTPNNILKFNFPMPIDFTEQAAIASVLSDMDDEIVALEAKLEKTRQIRAGMMEELLTGRIRLV